MREFHFNPLDEYDGKKMIKKGIPVPLFNALMKEAEEFHKEEARQARKR